MKGLFDSDPGSSEEKFCWWVTGTMTVILVLSMLMIFV